MNKYKIQKIKNRRNKNKCTPPYVMSRFDKVFYGYVPFENINVA